MSDLISFLSKNKLNTITVESVQNILESIQNISIFTIGAFSLFSYLYYNVNILLYGENVGGNLTTPFDMIYPVVFIHALIDFFLTKSTDLKIHHIFIYGINFYNYYYNVSKEYRFIFSYPLLNTEISSIFYVLKYWLPKKSIFYQANSIVFYITFFKFRIYDFYYKIIYNNISFNLLFDKYSQTNYFLSGIILVSCYGLYILNLYWFLIINKILYKTITKYVNINTDMMCHFLCSYLHWINIPLSLYIYSYNKNKKNIHDVIGITALTVSSYIYHNDIYSRIYEKKIEEYTIPTKDNITHFIDDIIFINVRSFLSIVTNYYNSEHFIFAILFSGMNHIASLYQCNLNILELFIDYDEHKDVFLNRHNIITGLTIACDVFLIFINSPIEISISFLLVNTIIGILFMVEPFYKLTHAAFHILLIVQNYYICLSSISK